MLISSNHTESCTSEAHELPHQKRRQCCFDDRREQKQRDHDEQECPETSGNGGFDHALIVFAFADPLDQAVADA